LSSPKVTSATALETMAALQELVIGIPSNEIADKLEKEAPAQHYIGAEPILSISITTVRSAIQEI